MFFHPRKAFCLFLRETGRLQPVRKTFSLCLKNLVIGIIDCTVDQIFLRHRKWERPLVIDDDPRAVRGGFPALHENIGKYHIHIADCGAGYSLRELSLPEYLRKLRRPVKGDLSSAAGHTVCIRRDHLFHGLPVAGCHRLFHEMLQIVPLHKRRHTSASPWHILCRTGAEGDAAARVCRVQLLSEFFLPADMVSRLYGTGVLIYFFLSGFIGYYIRPDTEPFRPLIGIF